MQAFVEPEYGSLDVLEPQERPGGINPKAEMKSIHWTARIAGALYLLIAGLSGFVHFYVPGALIVPGDAAATTGNIMASEGLFRMGMAAELVILLSEVALSVLLYVLLSQVNRTLSLVAAVSRIVMTTIHGVNLLNSFVVLLLLSGAGYLTVFAPNQLQALVMLFIDGYRYGFTIGIVFLALHASILGYLIFKSGYFPRVLGILFAVASLGYLGDSFSHVLLANHQTGAVYFALPIAIAEIAFPLWLLFRGVNAERWEERARAASVAPLLAAAGGRR
jgi:hypothetical protein